MKNSQWKSFWIQRYYRGELYSDDLSPINKFMRQLSLAVCNIIMCLSDMTSVIFHYFTPAEQTGQQFDYFRFDLVSLLRFSDAKVSSKVVEVALASTIILNHVKSFKLMTIIFNH